MSSCAAIIRRILQLMTPWSCVHARHAGWPGEALRTAYATDCTVCMQSEARRITRLCLRHHMDLKGPGCDQGLVRGRRFPPCRFQRPPLLQQVLGALLGSCRSLSFSAPAIEPCGTSYALQYLHRRCSVMSCAGICRQVVCKSGSNWFRQSPFPCGLFMQWIAEGRATAAEAIDSPRQHPAAVQGTGLIVGVSCA